MALSANPLMKRWQLRNFAAVYLTYFSYYLCRYNMPIAKTDLSRTFHWSAQDIGKVFSALTVCYAVGQFVNGQLGDRFGARRISSLGVLGSVVMNLGVLLLTLLADPASGGDGAILGLLILFWGANGFFQSMGWSPMVRLMAHWFPIDGRGKVMGLFGTSYQFGAAAASLLAIFLAGDFARRLGGDWRMVFLVPSVILGAMGIFFYWAVRDSPAQLGLPTLDEEGDPRAAHEKKIARDNGRSIIQNLRATLGNPYLWLVAGVFFMLDMNRYGFVNWMPAFIDDHAAQGISPLMANLSKMMKICIHPLAGATGALVAGWATDRFFGGRRAPVIVLLLVPLGFFSIWFPHINPANTALVVTVVALVGFCTYGPHILMVGHAAQDFGRKHGSSSAAGFIDCVGYIGASLAGWGAGKMIDAKGYEFTFTVFGLAAMIGAAMAGLIWKVRPRKEVVLRERPHDELTRKSPAGAGTPNA
ncbi:MAG: MFS transporter [bacterium]|nr:MFS transporter [bacterium]